MTQMPHSSPDSAADAARIDQAAATPVGLTRQPARHLRVREAADFLGVSVDTVRRWIERGHLAASTDAAGRTVIDGIEVARAAREHLFAPEPGGSRSSARNRFTGIVIAVTSDTVMSQVELQCGPYRVVSLMSTEAVRELGLEPGVLATAVVKSTHVVVEA